MKKSRRVYIKKNLKWIGLFLLLLLLILWWNILPSTLFNEPYSTVLSDGQGEILGVSVAEDEQYRFPEVKELSSKYIAALTLFEDKRFFSHIGVDCRAFGRAIIQNVKAKKVVSGGSTISMQVIRLSRGNPPRTVSEKVFEMLRAFRLELRCTKEEILLLYASHAPFGGNLVGIGAASWKYFGRAPEELSWAEAALLAVLPNAPSLKNQAVLVQKRDGLLKKLKDQGYIPEDDYRLALLEDVPEKILAGECIAPHLMSWSFKRHNGKICHSFLDSRLQQQVNGIVARHSRLQSSNHIYNMAVLVAHIPTAEVRAYVGNAPAVKGSRGNEVDIIRSVRSSGSILKPALYALMLESGQLLPGMLLPDIPTRFGNYSPSNFNKTFQGAAPADRALSMSLNIPFVRLLQGYGYGKFYEELKRLGITTLNRAPDNYGLSLILGGAETSLWDVCNMYAGMVSVLRHYNENDGEYFKGEYNRLKLFLSEEEQEEMLPASGGDMPLHAASVWHTLQALREVERPELESGWKKFVSGRDLAWKTGTSFGFRDAWAVGVNAEWVIGVWVGNADGEGRPGLTGVRVAAPVLFEVAGLLPVREKMEEPYDEMREILICRESGYKASQKCVNIDTVILCETGERAALCPYHRWISLDKSGKWRVTSDCESVYDITVKPWFVLPPVMEWYYARQYAGYRKLPPFRPDCMTVERDMMEMIYPARGTKVFIPKDFGGEKGRAVFELAHRESQTEVYWHIDNRFMGITQNIHQLELDIAEGQHELYLIDVNGNSLRLYFTVVGK